MNCNFSEINIVKAYAIYLKTQGDEEKFNQLMAKAFSNPEEAKRKLNEYLAGIIPQDTQKVSKNMVVKDNVENTSSYYIGSSGYFRMKSKFTEEILATSVLDIDKNSNTFNYIEGNSFSVGDISLTQERITKFKERLLNDLLTKMNQSTITITMDISDGYFTDLVNNTLASFETYVDSADREMLEKTGIYDSYVMLKNFDRLIHETSNYIAIDNSYDNIESVRKYSLQPKVSHYSSFSKDSSANIISQISNLAETLLKVLPEIEANGNIPESSSIGLSGFNGTMGTLKSTLLYGDLKRGSEFRKAYSNGADSFLEVFSELVDEFIEENTSENNNNSISKFNEYRQIYLHNKLRGIKQYLFSENTPSYIKNMFVQMFYKTEPTSYRVYSWDSEIDRWAGRDLRSKMIVTQKFAIQNVFQNGLKVISTGSRVFANSILKKFDIKIKSNNGLETVTIEEIETGHKVKIEYGKNKSGKFNFNSNNLVETDYPSVMYNFIQTVYSYSIPDTYENCITNPDGYKWENDFAPFVVLASKEILNKVGKQYGKNIVNVDKNNKFDLSFLNIKLLAIGQRLGVIYGDSVKNVINGLSNNKLPLYQLTSLEHNWYMCLDDARNLDYSVQEAGLLLRNEKLIAAPQIRGEVEVGGKIKNATKLEVDELNKLNIVDDFFMPFMYNEGSKDDCIYLQNTTFESKNRHFMPRFRLNQPIDDFRVNSIYKKHVTIKEIIEDSLINGTSKLSELYRTVRRDRFVIIADRIVDSYMSVFPNLVSEWDEKEAPLEVYLLEQLKKIDQFLLNSEHSLSTLRETFLNSGVTFHEEVTATSPKAKGLGKVRINETFLSLFESTINKDKWNERMDKYLNKFKEDLKDTVLSMYGGNIASQVKILSTWKPSEKSEFKTYGYFLPTTKEFKFVSKNGDLHPIAKSYFFIDNLFSSEFNSTTIGEFFAHTNKNKTTSFLKEGEYVEEDYLEASEASRFVAQIKRNSIFGATIHPFAQNIKDDFGNLIGVTPTINVAFMEDIKAPTFTPNASGSVDSQDGSGFCTALQSVLENNSLVDAAVGDNKKTILHDIDHSIGKPLMIKWAVFAYTNAFRRMSFGSNTKVESIVKKAYSLKFNKQLDLDKDYENQQKVWIKDPVLLEYEELIKIIKNNDGSYTQILRKENGEIKKGKTIFVETLHDIEQLYGGCWTFTKNQDGTFVGNETSVNLLAEAAIKYDLRDKQIAYIVNASAAKVGISNLNNVERWFDDEELHTYSIRTKYAGVMMDSDHALEDSSVSGMTQMISALTESGYYTELANEVYELLGENALNNSQIKKFIKAVDTNDREKVARYVTESLIDVFKSKSKDTIGLAQAFVKKANKAFKEAHKRGEISNYEIPFSDKTIFGSFVSDVTSKFTQYSIKQKREGFAAVQNPSYGMIQTFKSNDLVKDFDDFNNECKTVLYKHSSINPVNNKILGQSGTEYNSWQELAKNESHMADGTLNPFWIKILEKDVDFEDVLMVYNGTGFDEIRVNNYKTYDEIRNLGLLKGYNFFKNTAAPMDLRGSNVFFDVVALDAEGNETEVGKFSYYDIDSVRASQYLIELSSGKEVTFEKEKRTLIEKVLSKTDPNIKNPTKACEVLTQEFLEKLDLGRIVTQKKNTLGELDKNDLRSLFEYQECFSKEYAGMAFYARSYDVTPPEIIIGRHQMEKLGIKDIDKLWQIKQNGEQFFFDDLKSKYREPILNMNPDSIEDCYDKVLYRNGKVFLVKIGQAKNTSEYNKEVCQEVRIAGNDLKFESEIILSGDNLDKYKFSTMKSNGGDVYTLITVDTEEDFDELYESGFFDEIYRNNPYKVDSSYEAVEIANKLKIIAKDRYESFKQAITFVGARIPTQNQQSISPLDAIAFAETDKNIIYIPARLTYINGSDYDIDKLFLLAATILRNGSMRSGSAIQNTVGYDVTSKLFRPRGATFISSDFGFPISENLLDEFVKSPYEWDDVTKANFIYILNKIGTNKTGEVYINFKSSDKKKVDKFLKLLNKHSKTKDYILNSKEALDTRVFNKIREITTSAQMQLKAQVLVDDCTGEAKRYAENTSAGSAEKRVSPFVPTSKSVMQVQNMLGSSVVGVGAVSLKAYYMMSIAANKKALEIEKFINEGDISQALLKLKEIKIETPLERNNITTISGTNLKPVLLAAIKTDEELEQEKQAYLDSGKTQEDWDIREKDRLEIINTVNQMLSTISRTGASDLLSGYISLSADNAKDLALVKLNATEELIDIYTTAAMLGMTFDEVADIMTSDMFAWINKSGKLNLFDTFSENFNVKKMIDFAMFDEFGPWGVRFIKRIARLCNNYIDNNSEEKSDKNGTVDESQKEIQDTSGMNQEDIKEFKKDGRIFIGKNISSILNNSWSVNKILYILKKHDGLIDRAKTSLSREDIEEWQEVATMSEDGVIVDMPLTKEDLYNAYRLFSLYKERLKYLSPKAGSDQALNKERLSKLKWILNISEEMSVLGRQGSINQTIKTDIKGFYDFGRHFSDFINNRISKLEKNEAIKNKKEGKVSDEKSERFDFSTFLTDKDYAKRWIDKYNVAYRSGINVLDVIWNSLNFRDMSKVSVYAGKVMNMLSSVYRTTETIANDLIDRNKIYSLSDNDFKEISNYINDMLINKFLHSEKFSLDLELIANETGESVELYENVAEPTISKKSKLVLDNILNIASFKHIMDTRIIPALKTHPNFKDNVFVKDLTIRTNRVNDKFVYALPIQMNESDNEERYPQYLSAFNDLTRSSFAGKNIGDLFFIYNLISNKNSFGQQSMTRIFEDLVDSRNIPITILHFYKFIGSLDNSESVIEYDKQEVKYRLSAYSKGTKVKSEKSKLDLGDDFTFDLPITTKTNYKNISNIKPVSWINIHTINASEAITTLARTLESIRPGIIRIVDNEIVKEEGLPESRGFIKDGMIHLNSSAFKDASSALAVGIHELSHLFLATMKAEPVGSKIRNKYYKMLKMIQSDPEYDTIAQLYEDRVGSDLDEEVLCNKIERLLLNKLNSDSEIDLMLVDEGLLLNGITKLFPQKNAKLKDYIGTNLEFNIENFSRDMFDMSSNIKEAYIKNSQKLAELKTKLYKSKDNDYNLKQECK